MNSKEIAEKQPTDVSATTWLREIAFQLALLNEKPLAPINEKPKAQHGNRPRFN